jgi:hypothetical protein
MNDDFRHVDRFRLDLQLPEVMRETSSRSDESPETAFRVMMARPEHVSAIGALPRQPPPADRRSTAAQFAESGEIHPSRDWHVCLRRDGWA